MQCIYKLQGIMADQVVIMMIAIVNNTFQLMVS